MKNIHLIQTEKPSRLIIYSTLLNEFRLLTEPITDWKHKRHLYITSDEEIKDVRPHKGKWQLEKGQILNKFPNYLTDLSDCKLVIMTTDPDLIADGVQAIDEEFLEWFVRNPSCESIEVKSESSRKFGMWKPEYYPKIYKIIIPQEEPKQYPIGGYAPGSYTCTCVTCKKQFIGDKRAVQCEPCAIKTTQEEPRQETLTYSESAKKEERIFNSTLTKQETIEEAAERYATKQVDISMREDTLEFSKSGEELYQESKIDFIEGAKWQAERMYSDEEVLKAQQAILNNIRHALDNDNYIIEYLEQFKKK